MQNAITDYSFFSAGAAVFTVANAEGEHHTYRVSRAKRDGVRDETGPLFVGHLTGPDNGADYSYLGIFVPGGRKPKLTLTYASKERDAKIVKIFVWVVRMVKAGIDLPAGYSVQHEGKCGRCGRMLTTPESISKCIGPVCVWKMA
jgi:hypothetical protein